MKNLFRVLLCGLLIFGVLAGCAPRQEPEQTVVTETAAPTEWVLEEFTENKKYEGVELTFLSSWAEDAPEAPVLTQAAEVFEAQTGAVVQILWPSEGETSGDILQLSSEQLADSVDAVLDLTELAGAAGYAEKSFGCLMDTVVSRCGFLAGIPQVPYVSGFYYNREAFESCGIAQSPQNWESFLNVCGALASGGWQPLTLDSERADDVLLLHLTQYAGAAEALNIAQTGGWQSETARQAAADIFDFAAAGFLATGTPAAYPSGQNKIALSNSAFVYGTNALCPQVEAATQTDISWGMFPYPGVGGAEPVISVDADALAISAGCTAPQAAFDFIMLLTTGEFDQLRVDLTDGIPADPANASAITGAVEALQITQVLEPARTEFSEKQAAVIAKLWKGKYEDSGAFGKEMDRQYS